MSTVTRTAGLIVLTTALLPAVGCAAPTLTVEDCIISPGERKIECVAHVETEPFLGMRRRLKGHNVTFMIDGRDVGTATSDGDGRAGGLFDLSDDDPKLVEARAVVRGRSIQASAHVFVWHPDRTIICVDIDNTIAITDYDKLVLKKRDQRSWAIRGSRRTLNKLAAEYHVAYVTARPRFLLEKTRTWLDDQDFPDGPVITSPGIRQAIRRTDTKKAVFSALRRDWPNTLIGIGNSVSDERVYRESGMLGLLVNRDEDEVREAQGTEVLDLHDWETVGTFFDMNRDLLRQPEALRRIIGRGTARKELKVPKPRKE